MSTFLTNKHVFFLQKSFTWLLYCFFQTFFLMIILLFFRHLLLDYYFAFFILLLLDNYIAFFRHPLLDNQIAFYHLLDNYFAFFQNLSVIIFNLIIPLFQTFCLKITLFFIRHLLLENDFFFQTSFTWWLTCFFSGIFLLDD